MDAVQKSEVQRAIENDPGAFTALVGRYRGVAFAYALAILGDRQDAEDVVQEAFVAAHGSLARLDEPAAFVGWLRGIGRHGCLRRLRRRDVEPSSAVSEWPGAAEAPVEAAARTEGRTRALAAVRALPPRLREAVTLFYLCECTQAEAAAFLGLPVSTLNDRLHQARVLLRRRFVTMVGQGLRETGLPDELVPRFGRVLRVDGSVVDARFDPESPPEVFDALRSADGAAEMRVAQVLKDGVVRCLVTIGAHALRAGQTIANTTAEGGLTAAGVADDALVASAVASLGHARPSAPAVLETGIKSLDLLCPLPANGNVGLLGTSGTGKMVLTQELTLRLRGRPDAPRIFYLAAETEPALVRDLRAGSDGWPADASDGAQRIWVLTRRATDPTYSAGTDVFDATVYCSLLVGAQGLWPAVDPFHSTSRAARSERHAAIARRARESLSHAKRLLSDPLFLEYLACRAFSAARQRLLEFTERRLAELSPEERVAVGRARRLERFLTTPFFVAEATNGRPGVAAPLASVLDGVEAILDGTFDDVPEERFVFIGAVDEARSGAGGPTIGGTRGG